MRSVSGSSATESPPRSSTRPRPATSSSSRLRRSSDAMLASTITKNLYIGRTMKFQAELEAKIRGLTPDAVNAALRKYIDPKRLSVVTAGDFKKK